MASDIPLLPKSILTWLGTWLNAAIYYCEYYEPIRSIINKLNKEDIESIAIKQNVFAKVNLKHNLMYIKTNCSTLRISITMYNLCLWLTQLI